MLEPTAYFRPVSNALDWLVRPDPAANPLAQPQQRTLPGSSEPSYHPQIAAPGASSNATTCSNAARPYGPGEFSSYVQGRQARELDVDMMRLSYATYADGPQTVAGWTELTETQLREKGMDPGALDVPGSQFRAEVFTDGQGNYVLAFRGTQEGAADWRTNFEQGTGLYTDEFDRLAPQAAAQFREAFGQFAADADGNQVPTNLAITGHSQGGGLATVASLMTDIPAVTFDASGIHPVTLERLGLDPSQARQDAEAGQIRRYSMHEDALTQAQESWAATALLAPDALGHQIIVKPEGELDRTMTTRALEYAGLSGEDAGRYGSLLERMNAANDLIDGLQGPLDKLFLTPIDVLQLPFSVAAGARSLARAGISHEQQLMIDTMLQQQPWQPGYQNPPERGRALFDLVPQGVEDGAQRLLHRGALVVDGIPAYRQRISDNDARFDANGRLVAEQGARSTETDVQATLAERDRGIREAVATDFANGRGIAGSWSIAGDQARASLEVQGDRISGAADTAANRVRNDADHAAANIRAFADLTRPIGAGWLSDGAARLVEGGGELVADVTEFGGDAIEAVTEAGGRFVEASADVIGDIGQGVSDAARWAEGKMPWNW